MLRPSPNHGTQRLPNDDDDETIYMKTFWEFKFVTIIIYDLPNSVPSCSGVGLKFVK